MSGANCWRYAVRWQSWPNRSHSDRPRLGHHVLQVAVIRRRTEFGWGTRYHFYTVRHHQFGLVVNPASLGNGWQLITQAIAEGHIEPRGPSCVCSIPPALTPFNFHNQDLSPRPANIPVVAEWWEVLRHSPCPAHQEWGQAPWWGWDKDQRQWELWVATPQLPSLS